MFLRNMKLTTRTMSVMSLVCGLVGVGMFTLAVAADFWLYVQEPFGEDKLRASMTMVEPLDYTETYTEEPLEEEMIEYDENMTMPDTMPILKLHANMGLWRCCIELVQPTVVSPKTCSYIRYFGQVAGRVQEQEVTMAITKAIRLATPICVVALIVTIVAFCTSTWGNVKQNSKTVIGAVLYILGGLILAASNIVYISSINDEVAHLKKPANGEHHQHKFVNYQYGWCFYFAGGSFVCAELAAVINLTMYLKRYPTFEDKTHIIPGIDRDVDYRVEIEKRDDGAYHAAEGHETDTGLLSSGSSANVRQDTVIL
ncbi:unnamed protein product [Owenia fusiformis]|uniref:Uncharacterized protein n=1 Tax=Owenia fusiformis TaxID=6347 RepID=A0A8J1Y6A0_OWEFU|nr:unnamed protein product [Owenia fusiformis]